MNELQAFNNQEFGEIRTMIVDNEPWFVEKDVAEILGYSKARNAISNHVDEDDALKQSVTDDRKMVKGEKIMNLINVRTNENAEPVVSGRELHERLEVKTPYDKWFPKMCEYGFVENLDFSTFLSESTGGRRATDHVLKLDMAKEIAMLQRSEKGKEIRQYFIQVEKDFNSPEKIMARALTIANNTIKSLEKEREERAEAFRRLIDKYNEYDRQLNLEMEEKEEWMWLDPSDKKVKRVKKIDCAGGSLLNMLASEELKREFY